MLFFVNELVNQELFVKFSENCEVEKNLEIPVGKEASVRVSETTI